MVMTFFCSTFSPKKQLSCPCVGLHPILYPPCIFHFISQLSFFCLPKPSFFTPSHKVFFLTLLLTIVVSLSPCARTFQNAVFQSDSIVPFKRTEHFPSLINLGLYRTVVVLCSTFSIHSHSITKWYNCVFLCNFQMMNSKLVMATLFISSKIHDTEFYIIRFNLISSTIPFRLI